jgi:nucleotide-binding universal stress UspA family protein
MKILIGYDGSTYADAALKDLRRAGLPEDADALVLTVAEGGLQAPTSIGGVQTEFTNSWKDRVGRAEEIAHAAAELVRSYFPKWKVSSEGGWGDAAEVILEKTGSWKPDLIAVGSHGRSPVARMFLGSVALKLVHDAPCSVRVSRALTATRSEPLKLIVASDGSKGAEAVVRAVAGRSWPEKTEVRVISVAESLVPISELLAESTYAHDRAAGVVHNLDVQEQDRLRKVADDSAAALRREGLIAVATTADGNPSHEILAEAKRFNADAIFVGARGLGKLDRLLLGSVSSELVKHAYCTVEVVRTA